MWPIQPGPPGRSCRCRRAAAWNVRRATHGAVRRATESSKRAPIASVLWVEITAVCGFVTWSASFQHRFEEARLKRATATLVEQALERGTEEIKNHHVTVAMRAVVVHLYVEDGE